MKIYRQDSDFSVIGQDVTEAQVKGFREKLSEKFLIQVGPSLRNEDAQELARRLQSSTGYSVAVTEDRDNPLAGRHQVRLGDFLTRGDALAFFPQLNRLGHMDLWIVREEVSEKESHPLWVLVNDQLIPLAGSTMVSFIAGHPESYLTYEAWRDRFMARREEAVRLYDEAFARMWEFYLAASEMSFRVQNMMNFQLQLTKRQGIVPMTRDYIGREEGRLRLKEAGATKPRLQLAGE